jgi:hypothetical protein
VLEEAGYSVFILYGRPEADKKVRGSTIREDILGGGSSWMDMVPQATKEYVQNNNTAARLRSLKAHGKSPR